MISLNELYNTIYSIYKQWVFNLIRFRFVITYIII